MNRDERETERYRERYGNEEQLRMNFKSWVNQDRERKEFVSLAILKNEWRCPIDDRHVGRPNFCYRLLIPLRRESKNGGFMCNKWIDFMCNPNGSIYVSSKF